MSSSSLCNFEGAGWLILNPNVPSLIYYSHIPIAILSVLMGIFVLWNSKKSIESYIFFITTLTFSVWVFLDSIFWASNRSDVIMTVWSIILLIEPIVHAGGLYLTYYLLGKKDFGFKTKLAILALFTPLILFVPTKFGLKNFDLTSCLATEGPLALYYTYFIETVFTLWIAVYAIHRYRTSKDATDRKKVLAIVIGVILFLLAFSWGNIVGSFTEDWNIAQIGLFGMPVFIGLLAYSIVKFRLFNLKVIGANVLVVVLWILVGSLLFLNSLQMVRIIIFPTLVLLILFGLMLMKSVRAEVKQKEKIEHLAKELSHSNDKLYVSNEKLKELDRQKTEFVSMASHQLRSPLTAIKGYSSMLLEGSFGEMGDKARGAVDIIFQSSQKLVVVLEDFLNISRIELGTMKYSMAPTDLRRLTEEIVNELRPTIEKKGLTLDFKWSQSEDYTVSADSGKISQVVSNLIDNSTKYTPKGGMIVRLLNMSGVVRLEIEDTGVGITGETMPKLFQKFSRASDASRVNIKGTGLGLFVAKQIVEAHGGKIWAESAGEGQGSTFIVEFKKTPA